MQYPKCLLAPSSLRKIIKDTMPMLKIRATTGNGRQLLIIGLSHQNLERLKAEQPIAFRGETVDLPGIEIMIFAGETEQSMARDMAEFVGPGTRVSISNRVTDA